MSIIPQPHPLTVSVGYYSPLFACSLVVRSQIKSSDHVCSLTVFYSETLGTFSVSLVAALEGSVCFQTVFEGYRLYSIWIQDPSNLLGILNLVRLNTYINHTGCHHARNRAMRTTS